MYSTCCRQNDIKYCNISNIISFKNMFNLTLTKNITASTASQPGYVNYKI